MPSTSQALLVFVVAVVPGFLALGGYRAGRAVPEHPEGLVSTARVITISVIIVVLSWRLGGREVYDDARAGTALRAEEGHTYALVAALLLVPPMVGFAAGQLIDVTARWIWRAREQATAATDADRWQARTRRGIVAFMSSRLLVEGPSTWDRTWSRIRRTQGIAMVRVTTRGGREWVGLVADASRVALSPQPRDLYLEQVWRLAADDRYYPTEAGLGVFIAGSEIESVEWVSGSGLVSNG